MTPEEFKNEYPHVHELLEVLGTDNNMEFRSEIDIPEFLKPNLKKYEEQASQLDEDEKDIFAAGDDEERLALVGRTGFTEMDSFIAEAFDGVLIPIFYALPS